MEKEKQKELLKLVHTLYEVDVIEDEARNRLVYFAMNNLTTPTDTEKLMEEAREEAFESACGTVMRFRNKHDIAKSSFIEGAQFIINKLNELKK